MSLQYLSFRRRTVNVQLYSYLSVSVLEFFISSVAAAAHLQRRHVWPSLSFHSKTSPSACILVPFLSGSCVLLTRVCPRATGTVRWAPSRPPGSDRAKLINASCRGHGIPPADRPQTWAQPSGHEAHTRTHYMNAFRCIQMLTEWPCKQCPACWCNKQ